MPLGDFYEVHFYHEIRFLSDMEERFFCSICKFVIKYASQLGCGCRFCDACIRSHFLTSQYCPTVDCGSLLDTEVGVFPDNAINREIGDLDIECPLCEEKCKMKDIKLHSSSCKTDKFGKLVEECGRLSICRRMRGREVYQWRISDFNKILEEARRYSSASYFKGPICTELGYQMLFIIYPNGKGISKDSDISLFYMLVKGERDNELEWPFNMQVSFAISTKTGFVHKVNIPPDRTSLCNKRPQVENEENGVINFLSITEVHRFLDGNRFDIQVSMLRSF